MSYLKNLLLFMILWIFSGCHSNTTEPIQVSSEEVLRVSGALNTSFFSDATQYECRGTIKSWDIGNTLILSIKAIQNSIEAEKQISLYLYIPIDSDEMPIAGKQYVHELSDNISGVSYKSQWGKDSLAKYRFESGLVRLIIDSAEDNHITGKFSLIAKQSYGQRILRGQVENIKLANKGNIQVVGKINVVLDL